MKSLWDADEAAGFGESPLQQRVYSSRLLGRNSELGLHGGGNTSVKVEEPNLFGETEHLLYVKGSGWDLEHIEAAGFAPVRMDTLLKLAALPELSDSEMVRQQRAAMTDPQAPNPSVEAILHALIPHRYVDHTHADAVVTLTNTPKGRETIEALYGERVLIVPYVMPGFLLAKRIAEMTREASWQVWEGMVLMHHGIFSFGDTARQAYERMIRLVSDAEEYLASRGACHVPGSDFGAAPSILPTSAASDAFSQDAAPSRERLSALAELRLQVSRAKGAPMVVRRRDDAVARAFASLPDAAAITSRGPMTPDHIIRTKRTAMTVGPDAAASVETFVREYHEYFGRHAEGQTELDPAPRWAVLPGEGILAFGASDKEAGIVADIIEHTLVAIRRAELLGGWTALPEKDLFDMEYWELEQAKLKTGGKPAPFAGKVALITGAAGGIGRACAEELRAQGACVAALDIDPEVASRFQGPGALGLTCDVTDETQLTRAVEACIARFGGLDILVSNAGWFPPSASIENLTPEQWSRSLGLNLTSHQQLLSRCIPYLEKGLQPSVVFVASRNVPAPGPGAAAYSAAKAGLTQLARVAALELAGRGIRVNLLHPDCVYDTGLWTPTVLAERAANYNMSVADYKRRNLLRTEVSSRDVARLAAALCSELFSKTTGAQLPIDGGNERVV